MDDVVAPLLEEFAPTWLLISAGFDAHRDDPITGLGLAAADYAALTARLTALAPPGRVVTFLEGGYSLTGLRDSVATTVPVLAGGSAAVPAGEEATAGGPGERVVGAVGELWRRRRAG
jgi:acetoin utilization deacetylase AcuC-like enzyme